MTHYVVYGVPQKTHEFIRFKTLDTSKHVVLISSTKKTRDEWSSRPNTEVFIPQHNDLLTALQNCSACDWLVIEQAQNFKPSTIQQVIDMGKVMKFQIIYTHKNLVEQLSTQYIQQEFQQFVITKSKLLTTAINLFNLQLPPNLNFDDSQVLYFNNTGVYQKLENMTATSPATTTPVNSSTNTIIGSEVSSSVSDEVASYIDSVVIPSETHFHIVSFGNKEHNDTIIETLKTQSTIFLNHIEEKHKNRIKIKLLPKENMFYSIITHKPEYGDIVLLWVRRILLSFSKEVVKESWIDIM
jgi:hypothetical protein